MTAETLKPFITPQSVDNFPAVHSNSTRRQRSGINSLAVALTAIGAVLVIVLFTIAVWNSIRICNLEAELKNLNSILVSTQGRLDSHIGTYHAENFEEQYVNALTDFPGIEKDNKHVDDDDDDENDDDDDEDDNEDDSDEGLTADEYEAIEDYEELMEKYQNYDDDSEADDEENSDTSQGDNVYDDFGKFQDSKKKKQGGGPATNTSRKARAIAHVSNGLPVHEESLLAQSNASDHSVAQRQKHHHRTHKPALRPQPHIGLSGVNSKAGHTNKQTQQKIVAEHLEARRSPLRHRSRKRKIPVMKSGESLLSGKSVAPLNTLSFTPAVHFHLNRKVPDRHSAFRVNSYPGDMYIGHPSWPSDAAIDYYFKVDNGVLTVREPGLYYIYAQVCYNNTHDQNGFVIFHGHKPFLQCLNTVPTNMPLKIHTCHTSGLIHLNANETIHLRDFHSDRNVILKEANNRSYFGLIKI